MQPRFLALAGIAVWLPGALGAAPAPPDDLDIILAVQRRLAVDDAVQVEVQSGVAILSGKVDDWGQVQAAVKDAREAGATSVLNNLRVTYQTRTS